VKNARTLDAEGDKAPHVSSAKCNRGVDPSLCVLVRARGRKLARPRSALIRVAWSAFHERFDLASRFVEIPSIERAARESFAKFILLGSWWRELDGSPQVHPLAYRIRALPSDLSEGNRSKSLAVRRKVLEALHRSVAPHFVRLAIVDERKQNAAALIRLADKPRPQRIDAAPSALDGDELIDENLGKRIRERLPINALLARELGRTGSWPDSARGTTRAAIRPGRTADRPIIRLSRACSRPRTSRVDEAQYGP